jgi:hypothetical protein
LHLLQLPLEQRSRCCRAGRRAGHGCLLHRSLPLSMTNVTSCTEWNRRRRSCAGLSLCRGCAAGKETTGDPTLLLGTLTPLYPEARRQRTMEWISSSGRWLGWGKMLGRILESGQSGAANAAAGHDPLRRVGAGNVGRCQGKIGDIVRSTSIHFNPSSPSSRLAPGYGSGSVETQST